MLRTIRTSGSLASFTRLECIYRQEHESVACRECIRGRCHSAGVLEVDEVGGRRHRPCSLWWRLAGRVFVPQAATQSKRLFVRASSGAQCTRCISAWHGPKDRSANSTGRCFCVTGDGPVPGWPDRVGRERAVARFGRPNRARRIEKVLLLVHPDTAAAVSSVQASLRHKVRSGIGPVGPHVAWRPSGDGTNGHDQISLSNCRGTNLYAANW